MRAAARKARTVYGVLALVCMGLVTLHGCVKVVRWLAS